MHICNDMHRHKKQLILWTTEHPQNSFVPLLAGKQKLKYIGYTQHHLCDIILLLNYLDVKLEIPTSMPSKNSLVTWTFRMISNASIEKDAIQAVFSQR